MVTLSPPTLPPYIFLLSDHTTRQLAVAVAEALSAKYPSVYVDDFLAPIHEAYLAMFELDWKRDIGNPKVTTEQFSVEDGGHTAQDLIVSLEKWFIEQFGETKLGKMARQRSDARNAMADYITVFRDATSAHLNGFFPGAVIADRDNRIVNLNTGCDVDFVVKHIEGK